MNFRPRAVPVPPFAPKGLAMAALAAGLILAGCVRPPFVLAQSPPMPAPPAASAPNSPRAVGLPRVRDYEPISELRDIYFDFGKAVVRPSDVRILDANAAWLRANPAYLVLIEGHCDNRGATDRKNEFNMDLGERRAHAAMNHLIAQGVDASRITILSYGEERPQCTEEGERCWSQNRRSRFLVKPR
jgi:peptidoglycan-associated lipoprotein